MEYLARLNIVAMLMSTTFWINLAVVFFVTLITYWLINWLLNVVYKALQRPDKKNDAHGRLRPIVFEMLKKTSKMLIFFAAFLFSLRFVALPDRLFSTLSHAWFLVVAIQMAIWLDQGVQSWMRHLLYAPGSNKNPVTLVILGMILRVLVWSMMLLSILANVGVDITALVASLGVGGIAIALAVQTVLSDVFASLSIGFDKPFEIGDFVVFNDVALHPVRYAMCGHLSPGGTIYGVGKRVLTKIMPPVRGYLQSLRRRVCKARSRSLPELRAGMQPMRRRLP